MNARDSHIPDRTAANGLLTLVIGATALGLAPIFVRVSEVGPSATAFWRLALAFPVLWVTSAAAARGDSRAAARPKASGGTWLPVLAGLFFACDLGVWHRSIHDTTIANATLLTNLSAIFVPLFAWWVFRHKITRRFSVALVVALSGTLLLVGQNAHFSAQTLKGDALAILSAFFYTCYLFAIKAARERGQGTASIMAVSALVTSVAILPLAVLTGERIFPQTLLGWGTLLGLAGVVQLAGQTLITHALAKLPAAVVSLGLLLQPATATLVAWCYLGESLSSVQLVGAVVLLFGLTLARPR